MGVSNRRLSERAAEVSRSIEMRRPQPLGLDAIALDSGFPDFTPPDFVFEAMHEALRRRAVGYTPYVGLLELRQAIAAKLERDNGLVVDPESEIIVTIGSQQALMTALMALLDPGDEVITPTPHYSIYTRLASALNAHLVPVETSLETSFTVRVEDIAAAITPRTRALIVVTPNNPTGTVVPEARLREIAELAVERDLVVISDEIYEHYLFDGHRHVSLATLPDMRERTVTINSFSKGYGLPGLRLGYLAAPSYLIDAMIPFHHDMVICPPEVSQYGAMAVLERPRDWFEPILDEYGRRRQLWMKALDEAGLQHGDLQGTYYPFFDVGSTGLSRKEFVVRAQREAGLTFGASGAGTPFVRGSLMQAAGRLEEGLERLLAFVAKLS